MAKILGNYKVKIEGWSEKFQAIERLVVRCDLPESSRSNLLGVFGFRTDISSKVDGVYALEKLVDLKGGLIVGNGDSGKTVLLEALKAKLIGSKKRCKLLKLRDLGQSVVKLEASLKRINNSDVSYVLVDGIDEFPGAIDILIRAIKSTKKNRRWWVSSRPMTELNQFDCISEQLPRMSILPFSHAEANDLVNRLMGGGASFMHAVKNIGLLDFCTQPGGLVALLRVYQNGHFAGVSTKNILLKIAEDYCMQRKDGNVSMQIKGKAMQLTCLVDILGWMAVCLVLTRNNEFWLWNGDERPLHTLSLRECITDRYRYDDLFAALAARAIEPMGTNRARFSYAPLMFYLAANWLNNNVSLENASALLRVVAPRSEGQILDIQLWLSRLNERFKPLGIESAPEYFLKSKNAIEDIGFEKYYNLLEHRYGQLTFDERQEKIVNWLPIFLDFDVEAVVSKKLTLMESLVSVEFASIVVRQCKLRNCLSRLVDLVVDPRLSDEMRSSVSYNLPWLKDEFPDASEFASLLSLENAPFRGVAHSNIIGNSLDCLWPDNISAHELSKRLQVPFRKGYFGAYERFVEYSLPQSFYRHLDKVGTTEFLVWAKDHIAETRPFDRLGSLARTILTYAWKWVACSEVASAMKECLLEYIRSTGLHKIPFIDKESGSNRYEWNVTPKMFARDSGKRLCFLETMIADNRFSDDDLERLGMWFERFPLYSTADFALICKKWSESYKSNQALAARWSILLGQIVMQKAGRVDGRRLRRLSNAYPLNNYFSRSWLKDRRLRDRQFQQKQKKEQLKRDADNAEHRRALAKRIRHFLRVADPNGEVYVHLSYLMPSTDGTPQLPEIDVMATENYKKFNKTERGALVRTAEMTLATLSGDIICGGAQDAAIISAIVLVWRKHKEFFNSLPNGRIGLLSHCIFNSSSTLEDAAVVSDIVANFIMRCRASCFDALTDVMVKDVARGFSVGNALRFWKSGLDEQEIESLVKIAYGLCGASLGQLLAKVAAIDGCEILVKGYFKKIIPLNTKRRLDVFPASLLVYALTLFPGDYGPVLLSLTKNSSRWTRKWLLSVAFRSDESVLANAILKNDNRVSFYFYVWLERMFPECKRPTHEVVYSPTATDNIYEIKDLLITGLMNNCTGKTLKLLRKLPKLVPSRQWDYLLIRCQSKVENDAVPEAIQLDVLKDIQIVHKRVRNKRLTSFTKAMPWVIRSGVDLRNAVLSAIRAYDVHYLHGWGLSAFADIWNDVRKGLVVEIKKRSQDCILTSPKEEERLSDHLARYLSKEIANVAVTRENQSGPAFPSSAKCARKSAFHDITVIHPKTNSEVIVEVKGNWNKDLRGAGLSRQLQGYLRRNMTAYGIFVCGCFSSDCWCERDWRHNAVKGFATKDQAQKSLDEQLSKLEYKDRISVVAIDCDYGP